MPLHLPSLAELYLQNHYNYKNQLRDQQENLLREDQRIDTELTTTKLDKTCHLATKSHTEELLLQQRRTSLIYEAFPKLFQM